MRFWLLLFVEGDLKEIAHFKDLVKSYLKMERIGNGSK